MPKWTVILKVDERAPWCCYGPMTHREALEFRHLTAGTGMIREVAMLIGGKPPILELRTLAGKRADVLTK